MASKHSKARLQPSCYIFERNLDTLPFSRKVPFPVKNGKSELLITGSVKPSPTEFEITIRSANIRQDIYFQMSQRWNEDRAILNSWNRLPEEWGIPEYAHFPSLELGSDFTISVSTVQEHPDKDIFHFKVRVNKDPVVMFEYKDPLDTDVLAEVEITSYNNDISVTLVKLDVYK